MKLTGVYVIIGELVVLVVTVVYFTMLLGLGKKFRICSQNKAHT